ncbi:hypothetical protein J6590_022538 [Homalodisca vitripennis]|nr:hypothetical protein J6590_022538 [Homalodisca vitripennis]
MDVRVHLTLGPALDPSLGSLSLSGVDLTLGNRPVHQTKGSCCKSSTDLRKAEETSISLVLTGWPLLLPFIYWNKLPPIRFPLKRSDIAKGLFFFGRIAREGGSAPLMSRWSEITLVRQEVIAEIRSALSAARLVSISAGQCACNGHPLPSPPVINGLNAPPKTLAHLKQMGSARTLPVPAKLIIQVFLSSSTLIASSYGQ